MYDTDQYVARFPEYADSVIFFDRFCYDMVSLLGKNVFILQHNEIEFIFRKAYKALSHNFSPGKVEMLQLECVRQTPFQENQRYSSRLLSPEEKSMNLDSSDFMNPLDEAVDGQRDQKKAKIEKLNAKLKTLRSFLPTDLAQKMQLGSNESLGLSL